MDFPGSSGHEWSEPEFDLLEAYVDGGGFLVVTNLYSNMVMTRPLIDVNEDSRAINGLLERMGAAYTIGNLGSGMVLSSADHPLMDGASYIKGMDRYGVPFRMDDGTVLAEIQGRPALGLLEVGDAGGQVLIVSDLGLLMDYHQGARNLALVKNIAGYAAEEFD